MLQKSDFSTMQHIGNIIFRFQNCIFKSISRKTQPIILNETSISCCKPVLQIPPYARFLSEKNSGSENSFQNFEYILGYFLNVLQFLDAKISNIICS